MPNIKITDIDYGSIMLGGEQWSDETLTLAAETYLQGTIFARSGEKYVPSTGAETTALAVLPYTVEVETAGDSRQRLLIAGRVSKDRLVIHGETDPLPTAVVDALRDFGLIPVAVDQLTAYDNPNNP